MQPTLWGSWPAPINRFCCSHLFFFFFDFDDTICRDCFFWFFWFFSGVISRVNANEVGDARSPLRPPRPSLAFAARLSLPPFSHPRLTSHALTDIFSVFLLMSPARPSLKSPPFRPRRGEGAGRAGEYHPATSPQFPIVYCHRQSFKKDNRKMLCEVRGVSTTPTGGHSRQQRQRRKEKWNEKWRWCCIRRTTGFTMCQLNDNQTSHVIGSEIGTELRRWLVGGKGDSQERPLNNQTLIDSDSSQSSCHWSIRKRRVYLNRSWSQTPDAFGDPQHSPPPFPSPPPPCSSSSPPCTLTSPSK